MRSRCFRSAILGAFSLLCAGGLLRAEEAASVSERTVRDFVAAFNARELDRMLALADERIEWLTVDGTKLLVETAGRETLRTSMISYFASCTSCQATLEWVNVAGSRVAAFERSSWTTSAGVAKSQASLSVYELAEGKILRVIYFPVEP